MAGGTIEQLMGEPRVQKALAWIDRRREAITEEAIRICEIPAPPFEEAARAAYVRQRFTAQGLADVRIDAAGNVLGRRPGAGGDIGVALSAHLDTVFPRGTDVTVKRRGTQLHAPGIGDNSVSVAALLAVVDAMDAAGVRTAGDLYVAGNTGEEGLGNLRGMKAFVAAVRDRVGAAIVIDGTRINRIVHVGVGSRRYEGVFTTPGGHSWADFPAPSAVHLMGRAVAEISRLDVPAQPKTTYNVGVATGGTTVNSIAGEARMLVDMRSVDPGALADLERRVLEIVTRTAREGQGEVGWTLVGDRPAGAIPETHPVVQACAAVHRALGLDVTTEPSSTDANAALAAGIPSVCVGVTAGDHGHRLDEYIETAPLVLGIQKILLAALAVSSEAARPVPRGGLPAHDARHVRAADQGGQEYA